MPKSIHKTTRAPKKRKDSYKEPLPPLLPETEGARDADLPHAKPLAPSHSTLREDGTIEPVGQASSLSPSLVFTSDSPFVRLYHGNSLELLDAIHARYGDAGRFDCIFADPPYFLSNGGITCHAGKMVKVDKGDWDKSRGPALNHEFNKEWLVRCQRVLKPNGTIWVSGTHHVIFSIGYAMQELGFKILNDIAWEKPNPPPNLSCRYFTHSTETILWAAKSRESRHTFNYDVIRQIAGGKQMKTVWTMSAPKNAEKSFGKHPTQKPIALIERCLLASTNYGDTVLDPFLGSGTTAIVSVRLNRGFVGIELDFAHVTLARMRTNREIVEIWLRNFQVRVTIAVAGRATHSVRAAGNVNSQDAISSSNVGAAPPSPIGWERAGVRAPPQIDLDLFPDSINGSRSMDEPPQLPTERIFHETKFVFLSCAEVAHGSVVHTTVDVSLQEAWAKTPTGKKRETTHIVRCETEILRVKESPRT